MLIPIVCKSCKSEYEVEAAEANPGMTLTCPECDAEITIPKLSIGPGVTLGGFSIEKKLGEGAMGQVFLATQLSMDRQVALKILPPQFTIQEETVERFQQEVRMAAKVEHPNLVTAYEAGEDNGVYYMAIRYVDGMTVHEKILNNGMMDEKESLTIIRKVGDALRVAWNKQQLLHRDIKPDNIMLEKDGEPRLTDLGLAKSLNDNARLTVTAVAMGTPNYMSPEQIESASETDCRADIYSLGATLYHMVTGQPPFAGSTLTETLRKQLMEQLPDPRELNPNLSGGCIDIIELMLAKDKEDRYQKYEDLISDIDRVLQQQLPTKNKLPTGKSVMLRSEDVKQVTQRTAAAERTAKQSPQPLINPNRESAKESAVPMVIFLVVLLAAGVAALILLKGSNTEPESTAQPVEIMASDVAPDNPAGHSETQAQLGEASTPPTDSTYTELFAQLKKDNPGNVAPQISKGPDGALTLVLSGSDVVNIAALRNLPSEIRVVDIGNTKVWDLEPLEGLSLDQLTADYCKNLSNIGPLKKVTGLKKLVISSTSVMDLSPLKGMPLHTLNINKCPIDDLSPLRGMPLKQLYIAGYAQLDLTPIAQQSLVSVGLDNSPMLDVSPLAGLDPQPKLMRASPKQMALMERKGLTQEEYDRANAPPAVLEDSLAPLLDDLIAGNFDGATEKLLALEATKELPEPEVWKALHPSLKQTVHMEEYILNRYEALKRKSLQVYLNSGSKLVRIKRRNGRSIEAEVVLMRNGYPVASSPANFSYDDISTKEKLIRLGKNPEPTADVMKGLLALHAQAKDSAIKYFERSGNPTAKALLLRMDAQIAEAEESIKQANRQRATRERDQKNQKVRQHFQNILSTLGIEKLNKEPGALLEQLSNTLYSKEQIEEVKTLLAEIEKQGPDIALKEKRQAILDRLARLNPHRRLHVTRSEFDNALDAFIKANGGDVDFNRKDFNNGLIHLNIRGNTQIVDLSPLQGLPIEILHIDRSAITDFSALKTMALKELTLGNNPNINNLDMLKGLPLEHLSLHGIPLKNMSGTIGMPLEVLRLGYNQNIVLDLSPLAQMPLRKLFLNEIKLKNLKFLKDLPIEELSLRNLGHEMDLTNLQGLPIKNLRLESGQYKSFDPIAPLKLEKLYIYQGDAFDDMAILKDMPLKSLSIRHAPVRSLSPLQGKQITQLSLEGSFIKDLSPISGMPLQELNLNNCSSLRDLSPLAGTSARILRMNNTYISDLSPLAKMNRLQSLFIDACHKITDLSPLSELPINELSMSDLKGLDLTPLSELPLNRLTIRNTSRLDLSPLTGCPLTEVDMRGSKSIDDTPLRGIPTLKPANIKIK